MKCILYDILLGILSLFIIPIFSFGLVMICLFSFTDSSIIEESTMVKNGYAKYEFDQTNGESHFVWLDLNNTNKLHKIIKSD